MIAYACAIADQDKFRRYANPGLERAFEPDSELLEIGGRDCLFRAYNEALAWARELPELEALVLLHEDLEILTAGFAADLRRALSDPEVAVVGVLGSADPDVGGIDWWHFKPYVGRLLVEAIDPMVAWGSAWMWLSGWVDNHAYGPAGSVDGAIVVLSPWAVHNLRFDESLGPSVHGYDADIAFEARRRGKRVRVEYLPACHHNNDNWKQLSGDAWKRGHAAFARKWGTPPRIPVPGDEPVETPERAASIARAAVEARAADEK